MPRVTPTDNLTISQCIPYTMRVSRCWRQRSTTLEPAQSSPESWRRWSTVGSVISFVNWGILGIDLIAMAHVVLGRLCHDFGNVLACRPSGLARPVRLRLNSVVDHAAATQARNFALNAGPALKASLARPVPRCSETEPHAPPRPKTPEPPAAQSPRAKAGWCADRTQPPTARRSPSRRR